MSGKRIRTVKPEWLEDEGLAGCSDTARMVSVALIVLSDDYGHGRAHPLYLASRIWPYGSRDPRETLASLEGALRELVAMGFVELYSVKNQAYFSVRNWSRHQRIDRPSKPLVPGPEHADQSIVDVYDASDSRNTRESLSTPSRDTRGGLGIGSGSGSGGGDARAHAIPGAAVGSTGAASNGVHPEPPTPLSQETSQNFTPAPLSIVRGSSSDADLDDPPLEAPPLRPCWRLWAIWEELAGQGPNTCGPRKNHRNTLEQAWHSCEKRAPRDPEGLWRRMVAAYVEQRRAQGKRLDLAWFCNEFAGWADLVQRGPAGVNGQHVARATHLASAPPASDRPELQPFPKLIDPRKAEVPT